MHSDNDNKLIPAGRPVSEPLVPLPRAQDRGGNGYGYGYGYGGVQETSGEFNLRDYLRVILKNKWMIVTIVVVVTTLVAVAGYRVQSEYQATAIVQVGDEAPEMLGGTQPVYVYDYDGKRFNTQLMLLQTPDLMRKVVFETDLEHNPNVFSTRPSTLKEAFTSLLTPARTAVVAPPPVDPLQPLRDPNKPVDEETAQRLAPYVGVVLGGLTVDQIKDTQLITVTFKHHDPAVAAKVANAVAETFINEDLNQRVNSKATASTFLQKRIADLQTQIRAGEERLLNYGQTHEILSLEDDQQNTVVTKLQALNEELIKAESEVRNLEATRDSLKNAQAADDIMRLPAAQKDQGAQELSKRLTELRQKQSELSQKYTDEYPAVKQVNEQIAQVESDMQLVKQRILANSEDEYQTAVRKAKSLRDAFDAQRGETMQQNEAAISYRIIQQEVDINKKQLEALLQRAKEVDISAASERSPLVIKNRAEVPGGPSGPDRMRWIMMAFAGALFCGVALAFAREYLDQTIRSIEDVDRVVRLPSLGVIPALGGGSGKRSGRRALAARNSPSGSNTTGLITALEAKSSAAEAYRQLRTSVLLSSAGHPSKLLLVTSSQPREGKTTTAVNTAISLAQTGASTIIVDCDMRRPRVHQLLNASNELGVSLYLSGQNEDLSRLIQHHQIPNLTVLPCGPIPPNPAELLGSDQMRRLLTELSEMYDHVVIDTPPVVSFADPVILSTMVDGVILVVRGGFSSRSIVLRSRQILGDVGAKIYGVVLNDADMKSSDAYYHYGSYYAKYYGSSDTHDVKSP